MTPKILIISADCTISTTMERQEKAINFLSLADLWQSVPEAMLLDVLIDVLPCELFFNLSDLQPSVWNTLAATLQSNYETYDGFLIIHRSDKIAFTASALSFMLSNLGKPVIVTGSKFTVTANRITKNNLLAAIEVVRLACLNIGCEKEVYLFFEQQLLRGNRSMKYNIGMSETFCSPYYPAFGGPGNHQAFEKNNVLVHVTGKFKIKPLSDHNIAVLKFYKGIGQSDVRSVLLGPSAALIIETPDADDIIAENWFKEMLEEAVKYGKIILITTARIKNSEENTFSIKKALLEHKGIVNGFDMTYEAAITKMIYVLSLTSDIKMIRLLLENNLRGELSNK